jgi:hypothetical protein
LSSKETGGGSLSLIPIAMAVLLIAAINARRRPEGRALAIGICLGIGLPLLLIGLCFGAIAMR